MNASISSKKSALQNLLNQLQALDGGIAASTEERYEIPGLWVDPYGAPDAQPVSPAAFFSARIRNILNAPAKPLVTGVDGPGDWSRFAIAYNLLVRYAAAWDHNGDGELSPMPMKSGWRETGTFVKAIAMLPYIASLGCNVIHLLPITSIGRDGNKGNMGSAFAIRDPYALDEHLAEPNVDMPVDMQFEAFVEAAHHLGIRVIVEFVFRTAAKDAAWVKDHPEWFYWIRSAVPDRVPGAAPTEDTYGAPLFTPDELHTIYDAVGNGRFHELLPPHEEYRRMFTVPPAADTVQMVDGRWQGLAPHPVTGEMVPVRIPGAFCDWGPDSQQPPWTDVTYLRLYDHPDFNYIAYNTVRMYSAQLARPENVVRPLWDKIISVTPYYQEKYNIDGIMIDMGHALPADLKIQLIAAARRLNPDFALWAEEFNLSAECRADGYNLCVGPFMQTVRNREYFRGWLQHLHTAGIPLPYMGMSENHNTPRAVHWPGGAAYSAYAQTHAVFLPGSSYLHNGVELAEPTPVNTGFDFTDEETLALPADKLPLFSAKQMEWTREQPLLDKFRHLHRIREEHRLLLADNTPQSVHPFGLKNQNLIAYCRQSTECSFRMAIVANAHMTEPQNIEIPDAIAPAADTPDLISGNPIPTILKPAQVVAWKL